MNQDIQDVVDARLQAIQDVYMDEGAMLHLKQDLLHETRAEQVDAYMLPGCNTLHAEVFVAGQKYEGEVELSQVVPHVTIETIPAHTEVKRDDFMAQQEKSDAAKEDMPAAEEDKPAEDKPAEGE
jgi:hypothetical protein